MTETASLETLLPHKNPMIVLDEVEEYDLEAGTLTAKVTIKKEDILFSPLLKGVPSCASLEYMAQAIGCFVGYHDQKENPDKKPGIGFVLGSRKLEIMTPCYEEGHSYFIKIKSLFCDINMTSFECVIQTENDEITAKAIINAYRPENIENFMKDHE